MKSIAVLLSTVAASAHLFAALTIMSVMAAAADVDVYDNPIQYESDGVTVKYRFWYGGQTAEELSCADAVSASASPSADFEPRYLTWSASNGECPVRGFCIIIY